MLFLGHLILFLLAGFNGYLFNAVRGSSVGFVLLVALPIGGVYLLGWWALLTVALGLQFGARVYWASVLPR